MLARLFDSAVGSYGWQSHHCTGFVGASRLLQGEEVLLGALLTGTASIDAADGSQIKHDDPLTLVGNDCVV
jgi:hypothetical protein